ncbi:toxin glutamine deamidase domain-containing protein [Mycolicibacterium baixiangningiae]|uniref:toxin glutamine deamidase domain-containing protein n=1 Tax=Mycolicibacterium baixiangningiae TaxID=2761578 RepID=UPI001868B96C|nr:toxin glutamine deamidase domain-containing protein [Mycolicibacterium baixiangningiae]
MGVAAGTRIEVDPNALVAAGKQMGLLGTQLGMLSDALGQVVSGGIASGTDPAGLDFGLKYGDQAQEFATGLADAANAFKSVGFMLEATGHNYKNADAASTVGGSGPAGGVGSEPSETKPGDAATGPNSTTVSPPAKWHLIVPFLNVIPGGMLAGAALTWPSGNSGMMRLTAAQWRNLGQGLSVFDDAVAPVKAVVAAQQIPEGGKIDEVLGKLSEAVSKMSTSASGLAQAIDEFAGGVQETQDAIRRLLDRISLDGAWDMVKGIFTGEADDILREVARDVGTVLENFQRQVKGIVGLLGELADALGDAVTSLQNWVRPHLEELLGDEVGGALADGFTLYTDFQVGLTTGLINTVAGTVAMADPETWKGMAQTLMTVAKDPSKLPGVLADMGKEFVAWDKWSSDHPGRAAGAAAFNIGSLFVPGGALSKTGSVARGLSATRGLLDSGRVPGLRGLGSGPGTRGADGMPELENVGAGLPDAPEVRTPAIPESLIGPTAPGGIDAPSSQRGLEGPAGPPNPPGSTTGTPGGGESRGFGGGGDGPPPAPPGTPSGPPESGPGRADGPSPQSPASPGPGAVDPPSHAPTAGDSAPPATNHAPESSGPSASPDAGRSPSEPNHPPTQHQPSAPEANQAHNEASHPDAGTPPPSPDRHGGDHAPSETRSNAGEHNDYDRSHTSVDQPVAHPPAAEQHGGHEHTPAESTPAAQQPHTPNDGNTGRQESTGAPPVGMAGIGPMASHAPGATHTPDARTPDARTPDARTPDARASDSRTPDARTPESPRAQQPTATGPAPGHTPSAPVTPAAASQGATAAGEPTHARPEPHASRPEGDKRDSPPSTSHTAAHPTTTGASNSDRPGNQPDPPGSNHNAGSPHDQSPHQSGPVGNPADARTYGPHELRPVENPAYQTAVEDALRNPDGEYIRLADPRTNNYGSLVNDGGPTVQGRSNNCLDCSLSALSSFRGEPTVSAPRWPDRLPDGRIDTQTGEEGGLRRAADWLRSEMLEFPGQRIVDQFDALHQYMNSLGPGSAALVHNGWHARELTTGDFLYHPDGSPVTSGSHATVVVYPDGANGPVWWDPQQGLTSDRPPSWMTDQSSFLHFTPIEWNQGAHHGGAEDHGTGSGVSGGDVPDRGVSGATVPPRVGVHESSVSGADELRRGSGDGSTGDRFGDQDRVRVPELVGDDGGRGTYDVQTDGRQPSGPADLSVSMEDRDPAGTGGRHTDRISADGGVVDRPTGADSTASADDRKADIHPRSDGLVVDRGDVARGVGEPAEPGSVAGSGHDRGVSGGGDGRFAADHEDRTHGSSGHAAAQPDDHRAPGDDPHSDAGQPSVTGDANHRYVELEDGSQHRVWASSEQLRNMESRFAAADAWLEERGLTRGDVQPLLVQPAEWLDRAQQELVYGFRHQFPDVASGEGLQKIVDSGQADFRLAGGDDEYSPDRTGGSVSTARDTEALNTPERLYEGLALEYPNSPFRPDEPAIAMRFTTEDGVTVHVPDGPLSERAGHGPSYDPEYGYPFTGTGFTASDRFTVPEYFLPGGTRMNPGAEMYRISVDGTEELIAVLGHRQDWIRVKPDG